MESKEDSSALTRFQILITKSQKEWLRYTSYTQRRSIGNIIRGLIDKERKLNK